MTDPTPLDDAALDRLLGHHETPPLSAGFADLVLAEAGREDRKAAVPPLPPRARAVRRPWARRRIWAGVVAINLIVASAIAATVTGVSPRIAHVVAAAVHVFHFHRHEAEPVRLAPHPVRRVAQPAPRPAMPEARPAAFVHPPMPRLVQPPPAVMRPRVMHPRVRAGLVAHSRLGPGHHVIRAFRRSAQPRPPHGRADRPMARPQPMMRPQDGFAAGNLGHPRWGDGMRRPWAQGWRGQGGPEMRPRPQRGPDGWRRGGGGRGMGWRRPFGRGRRV